MNMLCFSSELRDFLNYSPIELYFLLHFGHTSLLKLIFFQIDFSLPFIQFFPILLPGSYLYSKIWKKENVDILLISSVAVSFLLFTSYMQYITAHRELMKYLDKLSCWLYGFCGCG